MAEVEKKNLPIAEEPEFITEIPAINPDDPVHFAQMNKILASLLGNDVFLDRLADKMIEKNLIAHVLDCENPQMVLGADQGPAITGLIDEVKGDVTQLYSEIPFFDPKKSYIDIKNNLPYTTQGNGILYISGQAKTERLTALEVVIDDIRFRTSTCTTSGNINLPSMTSFMMPVSAGCTIQINGRFDFCEFREAFFYQLSEVR